jgi:hypothetical protein
LKSACRTGADTPGGCTIAVVTLFKMSPQIELFLEGFLTGINGAFHGAKKVILVSHRDFEF